MPRKKVGPDSPDYRDAEIPGGWNVATEIGELASRSSGVPTHRRPGAQHQATPPNGQPRNITEID